MSEERNSLGLGGEIRRHVLSHQNVFEIIGEQDALDVAAQLGMDSPAFPFTVFTDRRGEVVALFLGELHRPQADLILSVVQSLNQDRVQLPEARRTLAEGLAAILKNRAG